MTKFKINAQTDIIDRFYESIYTSVLGSTFKEDWNIERKDSEYGSTLYFSLKEGKEIDPEVLLWIGYYAGQD